MILKALDDLQGRLGHHFSKPDLLQVALTHRSYHFENKHSSPGHFERLEFLGDAVLDLVMSEFLMKQFPSVEEGALSKWRASLVNETALGEIARGLDLGRHLYLGKSEDLTREQARPRLLASALEAVLAAVYLDGGLEAVRGVIEARFLEKVRALDATKQYELDYKTRLQEWSQKRFHKTPEYRLLTSEGPEHAKRFRFQVLVDAKPVGEGEGGSRKAAEQAAAQSALLTLEGDKT